MTDDSRLLAEADRSARTARKARVEGRCVACRFGYTPGTWIVTTAEGTIHKRCLPRPEPVERTPRKPRPHPPTVTPIVTTAYTTAVRRGRCVSCGARWQAGSTIGAGKSRGLCAPCTPVTFTVTQAPPA